ncbi:thioredoxin-dependent thiol peroxidase [Hirschia litorea]|uniref:thioredoxin-dependent peroxiredoxin n=1 Tax=Hirschia litorea TaxID=1199156 RepID=A0ABW2IHM2_9PROT
MNEEITTGASAPSFNIPTSKEQNVSLEDYQCSNLVVFFYPKDSTPGCTTEAVEFSAKLDEFSKLNTKILGISKDSLKRHHNFIQKNSLTIELGSDEDGAVCESFGVWKEKKNYGKTYMGIERSTFLIDENGTILKAWRKVRVAGHVDEVLAEVSALNRDS